jgi:N-acetylmuramoyl-L-alanine amidase
VLHGKTIILDAGHGAETTNRFRGYDEQVTMLALAQKIKPHLEAHGATVRLTRFTSSNALLSKRAAMVNIWSLDALKKDMEQNDGDSSSISEELSEINRLIDIMVAVITNPQLNESVYFNTPFCPEEPIHPDLERIFELQSDPIIADNFLFISLHSNATAIPIDTAVHGADVFHVSNDHDRLTEYYTNYSHIQRSMTFGEILLDHIHETGIQRQKVRPANYFVIREHNLPAVLVENGHHTNAADRAKLMSDEFLDKLALAYLDAILTYFADDSVTQHHFPIDLLHSLSSWEKYNFQIPGFNFTSRLP